MPFTIWPMPWPAAPIQDGRHNGHNGIHDVDACGSSSADTTDVRDNIVAMLETAANTIQTSLGLLEKYNEITTRPLIEDVETLVR